MSNLIHKLTKEGKTIYPATTTDAVVHPSLRAEITKIFTEYNISALFPSNGIDSGDKYNLSLAISILSNNLGTAQKNPGTKMIFKNKDNQVESWKFNGTDTGQFTNSGYWTLEGLADEKTLPQVKTIKFVRGLDEENNPVIIDQADLLSSLSNINKGYFPTEEELKAKYPTANLGDIAYVGTNYPYQIWRWNGESWVNTGETGGQEDVDLNNYYNKEEIDEKFIENGSVIPTLPVAPGENTTTWSDEEKVYTFKIGQFARVADTNVDSGYRFYQLYDITSGEGKAKWKETGIEYDVVTLDSIPGDTTLVWNNGVESVNFKIGQQVRIDSGNATSDKVFYQLYDIKNGLAVWERINLDYSPITLSTKPTEATLTWKLGNIVIDFKIGQQVRVEKEQGTEDYVFYQLFDIKDGLATWKEVGSGSEIIDPEDKPKLEEILNTIKTDGTGDKFLADNGEYKLIETTGGGDEEVYIGNSEPVDGNYDIFIDTSVTPEEIEVYTKSEVNDLLSNKADTSSLNELSSKVTSVEESISTINGKITNLESSVSSINGKITNLENKVNKAEGSNTVTTLTNLPVDKNLVIANLSSATSLSVRSGMSVGQSITIVCNPNSDFTQPIPTSGSYVSLDGDSLEIKSGKMFEINIYCYSSGKYSISSKVMV